MRVQASEAGMIVHATVIAKWRSGSWRGVLVFGGSGSGKSDLALRALQAGWRLVTDDYALVWRSGEGLWARAPETIVGRIEGAATKLGRRDTGRPGGVGAVGRRGASAVAHRDRLTLRRTRRAH